MWNIDYEWVIFYCWLLEDVVFWLDVILIGSYMFIDDGYIMIFYGCLEVDDEILDFGDYIFME